MIEQVKLFSGSPKSFNPITSADVVNYLSNSILYLDGDSSNTNEGNLVQLIKITVESASIRYSFKNSFGEGVEPSQSSNIGHVADSGDVIWLESYEQAKSFRYINKVNSTNAKLQITAYYI